MTDNSDSLVLDHLRELRAEVAGLREEVRAIARRHDDLAQRLKELRPGGFLGGPSNDSGAPRAEETAVPTAGLVLALLKKEAS